MLNRNARARSLSLGALRLDRTVTALRMVVLALYLPTLAAAQVGHAPGASPYRDIHKGHTLTATGGHFGGDGGRFGIAPHRGTVLGLRYDIRAASVVQIGLGVSRGNLDRLIVNPFVKLVDRTSGPVQQSVVFTEFDLQLNLTGGKSWRRLAPFVSAGFGLTFARGTPADTSGFKLGHKFFFVPSVGTRAFITDRLHLRAEARAAFWKLKYPPSFEREPPDEPGNPPTSSNAVITDGRVSEWKASPWLQVGVSYAFSP